jgi:uncharacterized DUF497 family protein
MNIRASAYNSGMTFDWDPHKAGRNLVKHGVSFEEAATVLIMDLLARTSLDPGHSISEYRFMTFGMSAKQRLLVVSYTHRGDSIRIISARPATKHEREIYEEH